jgi:hypothetical protein
MPPPSQNVLVFHYCLALRVDGMASGFSRAASDSLDRWTRRLTAYVLVLYTCNVLNPV